MNSELTEEQPFRTPAHDFACERVMPSARAWDEGEIFPVETLRQAVALGFGGFCINDDVGAVLSRVDAPSSSSRNSPQSYRRPPLISRSLMWLRG
jgi:alkylation response protein AidB-like acyl-CoA dehydrogenase